LKDFEVFFLAPKVALYPTAPLFDKKSQTLTPQCARALERIFILCDHDRDGALSNAELNYFQVLIFHSHIKCQNFGLFIIYEYCFKEK
jgi:Ras family protein T1